MIQQFLKLLWKQRSYNSLLIIEVSFSFIVLFIFLTASIHFYKKYKEPIGTDFKNLWAISIYKTYDVGNDLTDSVKCIKYDRIKEYLLSNPQIKFASKTTYDDFIYAGNSSSTCFDYKKRQYCFDVSRTEPDFAKTTGMNIIEGRWINRDDQYAKTKRVVINKMFKEALFGNKPAVGQTISTGENMSTTIVGVIDHIKRHGEFTNESNYMYKPTQLPNDYNESGMLIKIIPPINSDFEAKLVNGLRRFDKTFDYRVEQVEQMHQKYMLSSLAPIIIGGFVILFLIVNVMLGLFGTLWLNISRRKSEIGLRMALGSSSKKLLLQLLGETYSLALVAILIGFLITSQMFIFNIYNVPVVTLVQANLFAVFLIILFCTISAYIPARLAASLHPAEALHEE